MIITTEASIYTVDPDAMTVTRQPLAPDAAQLRRDGETLTLLFLPEPVVGQSCELLLQIRDDGVATLRTTTPVVEISE